MDSNSRSLDWKARNLSTVQQLRPRKERFFKKFGHFFCAAQKASSCFFVTFLLLAQKHFQTEYFMKLGDTTTTTTTTTLSQSVVTSKSPTLSRVDEIHKCNKNAKNER